MANIINNVSALEILDSRGSPTVLARVQLEDGRESRAGVPSGASTGRFEALELRDGEINRFRGKGVQRAVANIKTKINDALKGKSIDDIKSIDKIMLELDGTEYKSNLGANAILAVSLACTRLAGKVEGVPLYAYIHQKFGFDKEKLTLPGTMMNIMNGGKHSDSGSSIQEIMLVPKASTLHERVRIGSEVFWALKEVLKSKHLTTLVGDEGGYSPPLESNAQAFEMIIEAVHNTNFQMGNDVTLAIDAAATTFFEPDNNLYRLNPENVTYTTDKLLDLYREWHEKYYLNSIEDGLVENDWAGWQSMNKKLGKELMIVGDDLYVTNPKILQEGINKKAANSIVIKPNQIGTITETITCMKLAQANGYKTVVANRSGETIDVFISDLAVGANADFIKAGSLSRGERLAKYNRLMEIEMELSEWKPIKRTW
ncbi:phosphopyruvate hydratase [Patescibacteria group bacterium]|nr:phosphopyruvate hydratase [Patescibacteria group bacterium]